MANKLKEYSIQKMKESNYKSKLRSIERQKERKIDKLNKRNLICSNYRNLNNIILGQGESIKHLYSKAVTGIYLNTKNIDFISEFKFTKGESDFFIPSLSIFIELESKGNQKNKIDKKLDKYKIGIEQGTVNDVFVIPLEKFTFNFNEDIKMVGNILGL